MFVSYSWEDRDHVDLLCARLRSAGTEYWLDSERLDLDSALHPQLASAVGEATGVIFVDSRASRASEWVGFELHSAQRWSKPVVCHRPAGGARRSEPRRQPWKTPAGP